MKRPDMSFVYDREREEAEAKLEQVRAELEGARPRAEEAERLFKEAYGSEVDELLAFVRERNHRWMELWTPPGADGEPLRDGLMHFLYHSADEARAMHRAQEKVNALEASERRQKRKIQKAKREARKARED